MANSKSIFTLDGSLCCDSDMEQLTDSLEKIDGVGNARGSFSSNKVTVTYLDDTVSEDDLSEEIGNIGIGVEETVTFDVSD